MQLIATTGEAQQDILKTTCPYCGVGCGVDATVSATRGLSESQFESDPGPEQKREAQRVGVSTGPSSLPESFNSASTELENHAIAGPAINVDAQVVTVTGTREHPANFGRLCVKGASLHETLSMHDRLLHPMIDDQRVSWDQALDLVATQFKDIAEEHGPDSVAFYLSGQLLTEDYYVANKLMKGFVGTANVDTNSRLCMASAVVGYKRAFGADAVPCSYEDLECCDLLVVVGSNAAWTHPVLYQRIAAAKTARPAMKVVVVDPRRTATCDLADLHLQIAPGSDAALFNGLLNFLSQAGACNTAYIAAHTEHFEAAVDAAKPWSTQRVAERCDVPIRDLLTFFNWVNATEKTVTFYSQGVNQSSSGTDKCNAIINWHLATGRIGRAGMGPFSITGQPNAMGGREVGGLANQLAAHMGFAPEDVDRVRRFWDAPRMAEKPGLLAVDLFDAIESGDVKAVWIMATNPVVSLPNADKVKRALAKCDFVVVSDCIEQTDTARLADVLLPARGWPEKQGTVTNSERRISLQPALVPPAGEAQDDWWIVCEVAKRMGWESSFDYQSAHDIFLEHARLSAFENEDTRAFNIAGLAKLTEAEYLRLNPIQWPVKTTPDSGGAGTERLFADGQFFTPSRKAQFLPIQPEEPQSQSSDPYAFILNTGRIRDHWHTMTRTGKAERLSQHIDAPKLSLNRVDAKILDARDGDLLEIESQYGAVQALALIDDTVRPGEVFLPMHWTGENSSLGRMGVVVSPERDPYSGQPESKQTPVALRKIDIAVWGTVLCNEPIDEFPADFWIRNTVGEGSQAIHSSAPDEQSISSAGPAYRYEFGLLGDLDWADWVEARWGDELQVGQFIDNANKRSRLAVVEDDRLLALITWGHSREHLPNPMSFSALLNEYPVNLMGILAAQAPSLEDKGRLVCSCFKVGEKQILAAIGEGVDTVEGLGEKLRCGTNCGSCKTELSAMLRESAVETA
ncbi:MAG: molybdopterin-dependent oxidoreductase [Pseudomonadota bacterium]